MGKFLLPPLKFILLFIVSTLILLFFSLIYQWGQWVSPAIELKNSLFIFLPTAASGIIFPAASAALLFTFFDYRKKAISPVAVILTAAVIFIILFFGFQLTASMQKNAGNYAFQPLNERKLHVTDDSIIYIDSISDKDASITGDIIVRNRTDETPGFRYYKSGRLSNKENPSLIIDPEVTINISPANPVFNDSFRSSGLLTSYLRDIGNLNAALGESSVAGGMEFALLVAAFTAFLMTCLLFRGSTIWPLSEFVLILGFHRLVYYLFSLFTSEAVFISDAFFGGKMLHHIPLFTLTGLTLILFLCGLLIRLTSGRRQA